MREESLTMIEKTKHGIEIFVTSAHIFQHSEYTIRETMVVVFQVCRYMNPDIISTVWKSNVFNGQKPHLFVSICSLPVCDFAYARLTSEWIVYVVDYSPRKRISSLLFADALLRAVEEVAFFVPPNYDPCLISLEEAINEITFSIPSLSLCTRY